MSHQQVSNPEKTKNFYQQYKKELELFDCYDPDNLQEYYNNIQNNYHDSVDRVPRTIALISALNVVGYLYYKKKNPFIWSTYGENFYYAFFAFMLPYTGLSFLHASHLKNVMRKTLEDELIHSCYAELDTHVVKLENELKYQFGCSYI